MAYKLDIKPKAANSLEKINEPDYTRIRLAIYSLAVNARPQGYLKLKGREGYRIRSGDFRIIYNIMIIFLLSLLLLLGIEKIFTIKEKSYDFMLAFSFLLLNKKHGCTVINIH